MLDYYLSILFLIAPGFICRNIYEHLNLGGKRNAEGLESIISSLFYGVWIYSINYLILKNFYNINSLVKLKALFNKIDFIIIFSGLTVISCLFVAVVWSLISPGITQTLVNTIRSMEKKVPATNSTNVWDSIFLEKMRYHAVSIEKDEKEIGKGFINKISWAANEHREIYLDNTDQIDANPDLFDTVIGIYIDLDNNLTIKEYDLTKAMRVIDLVNLLHSHIGFPQR